ncbi:uncharacterized protein LOC127809479 [Diospyros lotus]|uniref:uncharacterized protein LOC127809479 n=1 Tax=Diospyros lotus TaxID=55363 RepID=UPI002253F0CD|nr:uncharacterized protein LOC127809479 [Diospyros lotus]
MSGGIGPSGDILLPQDEGKYKQAQDSNRPQFSKDSPTLQPRRGIFTFRHLNAAAAAVVLSASGMVSLEDFAFVLFSFIYMHAMAKVAFPNPNSFSDPPVFGENNKLLGLYVSIAAVIGLFLPIAYIFGGIFAGDKEGIKAAAPHVFLLASQVFMEGVAFSGGFSLPIRVFVPVFYNSRRIFSIAEWLRAEISKADEQHSGGTRRLYIGRGLAVANMALWCFNLFAFLLPVYLPKAFKKYYSDHKVKGAKGQ